jgi:hypothetical protein
MGRRGRRTLFSCTWKENRKKPQETQDKAGRIRDARGWRKMMPQGIAIEARVAPREARWSRDTSKWWSL